MSDSGAWVFRGRVGAIAGLLALLVFGCVAGPTSGVRAPGTVIDRYTIDAPWPCNSQGVPTDCEEFVRIARATITQRGVSPDDIVAENIYVEFPQMTARGGPGVAVVVFDLADGSQVAAGAYCGVGPCLAVNR